jgi:eukaryotic-like serine/threonine-protein kinase
VSWRTRLRSTLPFLVAIAGGFFLAYMIVAFVIFPSGVIPHDEKVPNVLGMVYEDAEAELVRAGFSSERGETRNHAASPAGTVLEQTPAPGSRELAGTTIKLVVSGGQRIGTVPVVVGMARADAETALEGAGYSIGDVTEQPSNQPRGEVIGTRPRGGEQMPQPGTVSILVSAGPNAVNVPDVIGRSIDDARLAIEQAGLVVGEVTRDSGDAPGGIPIVVSQSPAAGSQAPAGTAVTMRVSGG